MFEKNKGGNRRGAEPPEIDSEQRLDPAPLNSSVPTTRTTAMIGPTIRIKGEVSGEENLLTPPSGTPFCQSPVVYTVTTRKPDEKDSLRLLASCPKT